jgi:hypothetical protein
MPFEGGGLGLRFYVHIEETVAEACTGISGPEHVFIHEILPPWKPTDTVEALKQGYTRRYDELYGTALSAATTVLTDAHGVPLCPTKTVPTVVRPPLFFGSTFDARMANIFGLRCHRCDEVQTC